jgi:hypothetical protein
MAGLQRQGPWMSIPRPSKLNLVLVGTTGMIGGRALRYVLDHLAIGCVPAIELTELGVSHRKLKMVPQMRTLVESFHSTSVQAKGHT